MFVKVFDDLGTPLVLGTTNMLAPQAYLRITQVGLDDPLGYVISVIMIAFSILALWLSARVLKGRDYSTIQKGGASIQRRDAEPRASVLAYGWIGLVLLVVLSPHIGVLLLSFAKVWSFAPLPDAYTLAHYATVFQDSSGMIRNTLVYCGLAAAIDVILGVAISYLILRTRLPARQWLDWIALRRARDSRHRARDRLPALLQGRDAAVHRHAAHVDLGPHHACLLHPAPAVRAARLLRVAAADQRVAGGGGGEPRRDQAFARSAASSCR